MKKPRKYKSDSYWRPRDGSFILGRVDFTMSETNRGYIMPHGGCFPLQDKEFVFEVMNWRLCKAIAGLSFAPKYSLRPMWECAHIFFNLQGEPGPGEHKKQNFLRVENCLVIRELSHEEAMDKSSKLKNFYLPRRRVALN